MGSHLLVMITLAVSFHGWCTASPLLSHVANSVPLEASLSRGTVQKLGTLSDFKHSVVWPNLPHQGLAATEMPACRRLITLTPEKAFPNDPTLQELARKHIAWIGSQKADRLHKLEPEDFIGIGPKQAELDKYMNKNVLKTQYEEENYKNAKAELASWNTIRDILKFNLKKQKGQEIFSLNEVEHMLPRLHRLLLEDNIGSADGLARLRPERLKEIVTSQSGISVFRNRVAEFTSKALRRKPTDEHMETLLALFGYPAEEARAYAGNIRKALESNPPASLPTKYVDLYSFLQELSKPVASNS